MNKRKINVAIVGVGNCASSLVQGRYFYESASEGQFIPGLMLLGGMLKGIFSQSDKKVTNVGSH